MRTVRERIEWFRSNPPSKVGLCLRHTWLATQLPSVGLPDANAGVDFVKRHHKMHTDRNPPRGAWVWWRSTTHGHVALSLGSKKILSTDVNGPATVGTVDLSYPESHWNHDYQGWSSWYGVPFTVHDGSRRARIDDRIETLRAKKREIVKTLKILFGKRDKGGHNA